MRDRINGNAVLAVGLGLFVLTFFTLGPDLSDLRAKTVGVIILWAAGCSLLACIVVWGYSANKRK
ncbi:hypothetical protein [Streptomyces sp. NPDC048361]|uniref:hypothetical protein n=1 Tax=Streptomyces sp. NPDC048361 TaxID=3154720 RepID=UPI00342FE683